jgi:Tol biopolymer transport system component
LRAALTAAAVLTVLSALPSAAVTATTRRVNISSTEQQSTMSGYAKWDRAISADGRFAVFTSADPALVPNDTNGFWDIFVRDRTRGTTRRISLRSNEAQSNGDSFDAAISPDGRYVAFRSEATNLVPSDTNAVADIFIRDRVNGTTRRVSVSSNGEEGNAFSTDADISSGGRYVVFSSSASNLVGNDTNGTSDVFLRDMVSRTTRRISVRSNGNQGNGESRAGSISADGRIVTFESVATNLVSGDTNAVTDVFVRDRAARTTKRISVSSAGVEGDGLSADPEVSDDGRVVVFSSAATNLVAVDENAQTDVFVRILERRATRIVSLASDETQGDAFSGDPAISATGRYVAFHSLATNLVGVGVDSNGVGDGFVRDRRAGTTRRVTVAAGGTEGNAVSYDLSISGDGRFVVFNSHATNLTTSDTNGVEDVFIRGPLS